MWNKLHYTEIYGDRVAFVLFSEWKWMMTVWPWLGSSTFTRLGHFRCSVFGVLCILAWSFFFTVCSCWMTPPPPILTYQSLSNNSTVLFQTQQEQRLAACDAVKPDAMKTQRFPSDCTDGCGARDLPLLSMWPCSFHTVPPSLLLWLQRSLLLPDHRHPGVPAGLSMLTDPSHRHARVHPGLGRGHQRTQGPRFLCGHRPTAQPDQRLQPWTRTHRPSLPVSLPVLYYVEVGIRFVKGQRMESARVNMEDGVIDESF